MKSRYNVYPLWVLAQVQRYGSISRAADELEITQPAVSAQLKVLEQEHGKLYHRAGRGVVLTEKGRQLLEGACRIFAELDEMERLFGGDQEGLRGRIRLGASTVPSAFLLPRAVALFKTEHPAVSLQINISSSMATLQALLDDSLSFAVVGEIYGRQAQGPLAWEPWREDRLGLYSHPKNPLQDESLPWSERLPRCCLLLREKGSSTRAAAEEMLRPLKTDFHSIVEIGSSEVIREWVLANLGAAVMSSLAIERELEAGLLKPVDLCARGAQSRTRPFFLVRRKDRGLTPVEEALWDSLLATA